MSLGAINPSAEFCETHGGVISTEMGPLGEYGVCSFPDGSSCKAWEFFRGECMPGSQGGPIGGKVWCANGSMWIPLAHKVDTSKLEFYTFAGAPGGICECSSDSTYYKDPITKTFYATHPGSVDFYWAPAPEESGGFKWWHGVLLAGVLVGAVIVVKKAKA